MITAWATADDPGGSVGGVSGPYASTRPATSHPRIRGSPWGGAPTPFRVQRSWWLSETASVRRSAQPALGSGRGLSPTSRLASGSSPPTLVA